MRSENEVNGQEIFMRPIIKSVMEGPVAIKKLDALEYGDILARANRTVHLARRQSHQTRSTNRSQEEPL